MGKPIVKKEKDYHREAFELYYLMGQEERSLTKLAKRLNRPKSTIQSWSESFDWKERVEIRDAEIQRQFEDRQKQNNDTIVDMKAHFHKFLKFLIAQALKDANAGNLRITKIKELVAVMELDLVLLGEDERKNKGQIDALNQAIQASMQMANLTDGDDDDEDEED